MEKKKILFLCTGNSCRSQMAEGWARHLFGDVYDAYSAGVIAGGMNPYVVGIMKEAGVDISGQYSKTIDALTESEFDMVVTLCDHAAASCPVFSGARRTIHVPFDDPYILANDDCSEDEKMAIYRRVRDEIAEFIKRLPEELK